MIPLGRGADIEFRRVRLQVFGHVTLTLDGRCVNLPRKTAALLAMLTVDGGRDREWLAGVIWPEVTTERGLHDLRNALYELRKVAPDVVDAGKKRAGDVVRRHGLVGFQTVELSELVETDIGRFRELARIPTGAAFELYGGELCEDLTGIKSESWHEWLDKRREELHQIALRCGADLVRNLTRLSLHYEAIEVARRLVRMDSYFEPAHRLLMRALAAAGRNAEATLHYEAMEASFRRELACRPSQKTIALGEALRGAARGHRRVSVMAPPGAAGPDSPNREPFPVAASDLARD
jgi:DNA-binding SARP family transcriptional activator